MCLALDLLSLHCHFSSWVSSVFFPTEQKILHLYIPVHINLVFTIGIHFWNNVHEDTCPKRRTTLLLLSAEENCPSVFCSLFNIKCYLDRHIITLIILSMEHLQGVFFLFSLLNILRTVLGNFTCKVKLNLLSGKNSKWHFNLCLSTYRAVLGFLLIDLLYGTGMLHWDCSALQLQGGIWVGIQGYLGVWRQAAFTTRMCEVICPGSGGVEVIPNSSHASN